MTITGIWCNRISDVSPLLKAQLYTMLLPLHLVHVEVKVSIDMYWSLGPEDKIFTITELVQQLEALEALPRALADGISTLRVIGVGLRETQIDPRNFFGNVFTRSVCNGRGRRSHVNVAETDSTGGEVDSGRLLVVGPSGKRGLR